jgi:pumilio RNA-binding family
VEPLSQISISLQLKASVLPSDANHVIQKVVTTCPPDLLQFVVDAFIGNVYTFATHPYSCRVLQRILENCPERMTRPLLEELKAYAQNL